MHLLAWTNTIMCIPIIDFWTCFKFWSSLNENAKFNILHVLRMSVSEKGHYNFGTILSYIYCCTYSLYLYFPLFYHQIDFYYFKLISNLANYDPQWVFCEKTAFFHNEHLATY